MKMIVSYDPIVKLKPKSEWPQDTPCILCSEAISHGHIKWMERIGYRQFICHSCHGLSTGNGPFPRFRGIHPSIGIDDALFYAAANVGVILWHLEQEINDRK